MLSRATNKSYKYNNNNVLNNLVLFDYLYKVKNIKQNIHIYTT